MRCRVFLNGSRVRASGAARRQASQARGKIRLGTDRNFIMLGWLGRRLASIGENEWAKADSGKVRRAKAIAQ
jgi:hypothetical protein